MFVDLEAVARAAARFRDGAPRSTTRSSMASSCRTSPSASSASLPASTVPYLVPAPAEADPRAKALYAPSPEQEGNASVLELIRARAELGSAATVYRT